MKVRGISVLMALLIVAGSFVGSQEMGSADGHLDQVVSSTVYFPYVPNGAVIDETGPWHGSVTVQNLETDQTIRIFALTSVTFQQPLDDDVWNTTLQPNASKTFTADQLDLPEPGSALVLLAITEKAWVALNAVPEDYEGPWEYEAPSIAAVMKQAAGPEMTNARTTDAHLAIDGHTGIPGADVAWGSGSELCYVDLGLDFCAGIGEYVFGDGLDLDFSGSSYLPIVQTNSGWNTTILASNVDGSIENAGLNIVLIPEAGSTFGSGQIQETFIISPGETIELDLREYLASLGMHDEWVGSAWLESDVGIVSSAFRSNADSNMLMINTAAPSFEAWSWFDEEGAEAEIDDDLASFQAIGDSAYEFYGPLVFQSYNDWNSGISIVNTAELTNTVDVTFYGPGGNAIQGESLTIPPRGMDYIYTPASQVMGLEPGFVGSVVLRSEAPFHASIDQVKYETGEAMSYIATAAGASSMYDSASWPGGLGDLTHLGMPLVQKGSAYSGEGDMSGLQLFNASSQFSSRVQVEFFLSGGSLAAPTQNSPIELTLTPVSSATLYVLDQSQMAQHFLGSAIVSAVECSSWPECGSVVGVSNNVNYAVQGDGALALNMVNSAGQFRFPYSQIFSSIVYGGDSQP